MLSQHYFLMFAIRLSRSTHFRYKITTFFANMQISAHFCTKNLKIDKSIWHFPPSPHPRALSPDLIIHLSRIIARAPSFPHCASLISPISSCTSRASLREPRHSPIAQALSPHLIIHFSRIIARAPSFPHCASLISPSHHAPLAHHCASPVIPPLRKPYLPISSCTSRASLREPRHSPIAQAPPINHQRQPEDCL